MGDLMKPEEPGNPSALASARPRAWTIVLPKPATRALCPEAMNASELMFFFGAPLAHVVDYEEHVRASRQEKASRVFARSRRALEMVPHAEPARLSSPG
jgi:hypothetical protein